MLYKIVYSHTYRHFADHSAARVQCFELTPEETVEQILTKACSEGLVLRH